jgi:hypothetical protein
LGTFNSSLNESAFEGSRPFETYKNSVYPALEGFRPDRESRADCVIAYNLLARFTRPLTPQDKPGGEPLVSVDGDGKVISTMDDKIKAKLDEISPHAFGPSGSEMVTEGKEISKKSETFEWHGTPIMIGLTGETKKALANPDETPVPDLTLYRDTENRWMVRGWETDVEYIPKTGLSIGRGTTVAEAPHLEKTIMLMNAGSRDISRKHLTLLPQQDGTIKILDDSTNGTYVRDQYVDKKRG